MKTLIFLTLFFVTLTSEAASAQRSLASVRRTLRIEHARELMGTHYRKSIVSRQEHRQDLERNIHRIVDKQLPKSYRNRANSVAKTIIHEAAQYALDPYFVLAVIAGESSFNPLAIGPVGEIGLMQIRMSTGEWMANAMKIKWQGEKSLRDPIMNIKLGVAYLGWLRTKFEGHGQLYVAAYNMGPKSVKNAIARNIYPKDYPIHVMKRYVAFYRELDKKKQL